MKVAYFAHASNLTGANRALIEMIMSLKIKKVDPIVFIPQNGPIEEELKTNRIKYYIFPYKPWVYNIQEKSLKQKIKHSFREPYNFLLALKVAKILKKEKVELIHSNSLITGFGGQVATVTHLPHVWHFREFLEEDHNIKFDNERIAKDRMRKANVLVAVSDIVASKFKKKYGYNVLTIYDGVNIKKYSIPKKRILTKSEAELTIMGRIVVTKGQMDAVKAVEILKQRNIKIHLQIIGDGTGDGELERIKEYVTEHSLEDDVEYIPFVTDISSYSRNCDIQLVCSSNEAFGRVTIEGMLSHSLVIGADAGCTPYLIKDGETGLLYTCRDPESLADKIEWGITHKERAQAIADEGYKHGQYFSITKNAEGIYKLYVKILNEKPTNNS